MTEDELKLRTKKYALRVINLVNSLPYSISNKNIGSQLLRCSTSVAANYRAACRARSLADFISKLSIVEEEADESLFWLEIMVESGMIKIELLKSLMMEIDEIISIVVTSIKTSKSKIRNLNSKIQ